MSDALTVNDRQRIPDDLAPRLPDEARKILLALRQLRDDRLALVRVAGDAYVDARENLNRLRQEREHIRAQQSANSGRRHEGVDKFPEVIAISKLVAAAEHNLGRAAEIRDERQRAWNEIGTLIDHVEQFFRGTPAAAIKPYAGPQPTLRKNETAKQAVGRLRTRLAELVSEQTRVATAPVPLSEAHARLTAQVNALGDRGRPDVTGLFSPLGAEIAWPPLHLPIPSAEIAGVNGRGIGLVRMPPMTDVMALLAWFHRDELLQRLGEELAERAPAEADALTNEQRAQRLAEIDQEILMTERAEQHFIRLAMEEGQIIPHRPNTNPLAVLGVDLVDVPEQHQEEAA